VTNQKEFEFPSTPSEVLDLRLKELVETLRGRGWMTSAQLKRDGFNERELRELVEFQTKERRAVVFSYPGSPGYKAFHDVTLEEFIACTSLKTQGEKMIDRYMLYMRNYHRPQPRGDADDENR